MCANRVVRCRRCAFSAEDIKKIQEVLATDREVYSEGRVTGYFGPLTRQALERFQKKFELEVTGTMNDETRAALEELLKARFGEGKVPPGLLTASGLSSLSTEYRMKSLRNDTLLRKVSLRTLFIIIAPLIIFRKYMRTVQQVSTFFCRVGVWSFLFILCHHGICSSHAQSR